MKLSDPWDWAKKKIRTGNTQIGRWYAMREKNGFAHWELMHLKRNANGNKFWNCFNTKYRLNFGWLVGHNRLIDLLSMTHIFFFLQMTTTLSYRYWNMKIFTPVECVCLVQNKNKIVVSFIIKCVNIVKLVSLEMQSLMKDKKRSHIW